MRKVLLMIDEASVGGGQMHVLAIARGVRRDKYDVHVACEEKGFLVEQLKATGIPVHPLAMSNRPDLRSFAACSRLFRDLQPDIVHTHGGTAGFLARTVSLIAPAGKRIHTYHGLHYLHHRTTMRNRVFCMADRILKHATDRLVCVAESDRILGTHYGVVDPAKTVLIRPGIDLDQFIPGLRRGNRDRGEQFVIGTIGRLHVQKGHRFLLAAAAIVSRKIPEAIFTIIGDGELRVDLEAEIRDLGLQSTVHLQGTRTDTAELLASLDCFVLPSLWEGLPIVLLEAMASALPVVATAVDGVREAVTDGVEGFLVPPGLPEPLADAIVRVRNEPALAGAMAGNARLRVEKEFSLSGMIREIEALYDTVLSE